MLIDRIDKKLLKDTLPDDAGMIFYIDEPAQDFTLHTPLFEGKTLGDIPLSQKPPYERFTLHFSDGLVTYVFSEIDNEKMGLACDSFFLTSTGMVGSLWPNGNEFMVLYGINEKLEICFFKLVNRFSQEVINLSGDEIECDQEGWRYCAPYYLLHNFLAFLSCKNVTTDDVVPPEKVQKKRKNKNKAPLVSYKILKLKSISNVHNDNPGKIGLWANRIHLCRGHMREYTAERPLFGRFIGRYWIPPHARGNRKLGAVQKDYALGVSQREVETSL